MLMRFEQEVTRAKDGKGLGRDFSEQMMEDEGKFKVPEGLECKDSSASYVSKFRTLRKEQDAPPKIR